MGSYWELRAGRRDLMWGKNYVPDPLMLIFNDSDRKMDSERFAALEARWSSEDDSTIGERPLRRIHVYEATAESLKARLSIQGFSATAVTKHAIRFIDAELNDPEAYSPDDWDQVKRKHHNNAGELMQAMLTWHSRGGGRRFAAPEDPEEQFMHSLWHDLVEVFDDPRFELALVLARTRDTTIVTLDLTDLLLGGYLEPDEVPHRTARTRFASEVAASGRVIVITEGRTDADFLTRAIAIAEPDLMDSFSFLDFDGTSSPGGVDRVVSLTRGMAAAKVMNRIVAVLDNDTAGRGALEQLKRSNLPPRITATLLPDVEFGFNYPTLGPEGIRSGNINGRAVTVEMMFGPLILRAPNEAALPAIRWTGYNSSVGDYQGSLEGAKGPIQDRIRRVLRAGSIDSLDSEVADGCRRLASMLIRATAEATPALASDVSPLLWARVRE